MSIRYELLMDEASRVLRPCGEMHISDLTRKGGSSDGLFLPMGSRGGTAVHGEGV